MKQEEIKQRLMRYPSIMQLKPEYGGGWSISDRDMDAFLAEIAKLVDEEFAEAISSALDSYIIQLDAKEAQLAEMREALEWIVQEDNPARCEGDYPDPAFQIRAAVERAEKALSAAPEVLYSFQAPIQQAEPELYGDVVTVWESPRAFLKMYESGLGRLAGKQVKVIVVAKEETKDDLPAD